MQKQCLCCGESFEAKRPFAKYCSAKCKTKFLEKQKVKEISCEECGKLFTPSNRKVKFCSTSCSSKSNHRNARKEVTCKLCGKKFEFKGTTTSKYCEACANFMHSERVKNWRERQGILTDRGAGKGGWQKEGDNATTRSRDGATNREKEYQRVCAEKFSGVKKCVMCSSERNIYIHHIDHDPFNHSKENLTYLCSKCHRVHHSSGTITTQDIVEATHRVICHYTPLTSEKSKVRKHYDNSEPKSVGDNGTV